MRVLAENLAGVGKAEETEDAVFARAPISEYHSHLGAGHGNWLEWCLWTGGGEAGKHGCSRVIE